MLQSHHTPGPLWAVPGLFWTKLYVHPRGPYGSRAASYEFCLPVRARRVLCMHYKLTGPVRVRDRKQPMKPVRGPSRRATYPVGYTAHCRFPCEARTTPVRASHGVMRISWSNHKCIFVSSCTRPAAWCDSENSADVKFPWTLHLALRKKSGSKNRTGLDVTIASTNIAGFFPVLLK